MQLRLGQARGPSAAYELDASLDTAADLIAQSLQASRSLTVELSPPVLYRGGLAPAMEWLAHWMHEKHGLDGGFGLFSIAQRLESFAGSMQIDSAPGHGTRITLRVPIAEFSLL